MQTLCLMEEMPEAIRFFQAVHTILISITILIYLFYFKSSFHFLLTITWNFYINVAQPRRRGASKGVNLQQMFVANRCRLLSIKFDWVERTLIPIGSNSNLFSRYVGNQIKYYVAPYYNSFGHRFLNIWKNNFWIQLRYLTWIRRIFN